MPDAGKSSLGHLRHWWLTPLVGAAGGYLASLVAWPLPWLTGALLSVIALRCCGVLSREIPGGRQVGQWLVAAGIGLHLTSEVLSQILANLPTIIAGVCATLLFSCVGIMGLRRNGVDRATAFFACMPGGASEMVNLSLRHGAQPARIAAAHSMRLLMLVLLVPALFTWGLAKVEPMPAMPVNWAWLALLLPSSALLALIWRRLDQPNPWMLGPLTLCATASVTFDLHMGLPDWLGHVGQWLIGSALACHFDKSFFRSAPGFLLRVILFTLLAMLFTALFGMLLGWLADLEPSSLVLGMMPGGITELCLTAEALHLSVALVTALQVLRLFMVMFLAEPLYRCWIKMD